MVNKSRLLQQLAEEVVQLQVDHQPHPKEQRLLNLLSQDTSTGRQEGSKKPANASRQGKGPNNIVAAMMRDYPGMTEERARELIELHGG